jgi:hypothetical protein
MTKTEDTIRWLPQCTTEYQAMTGGMSETVEDFDDVVKLGQGFSTIYELEEVDLGTGGISRLTYINACLTSNEKDNLHEVLREYAGCFA